MDPRPGGFRSTVVPAISDSSAPRADGLISPPHDIAGDIEAELAQLDGLALVEQVALFADIHQRLPSALNATSGQAEHEQRPQPRSR